MQRKTLLASVVVALSLLMLSHSYWIPQDHGRERQRTEDVNSRALERVAPLEQGYPTDPVPQNAGGTINQFGLTTEAALQHPDWFIANARQLLQNPEEAQQAGISEIQGKGTHQMVAICGKNPQEYHFLSVGSQRYTVAFSTNLLKPALNQEIWFQGYTRSNRAAIAAYDTNFTVRELEGGTSTTVTGNKRVLFLNLELPQPTINGIQRSNTIKELLTTARLLPFMERMQQYYTNNSQGRVTFSWEVLPVTLHWDWLPVGTEGFFQLRDVVITNLLGVGPQYHPTNFDCIITYHTRNGNWGWDGVAEIGGKYVMLNEVLYDQVLTHEMGHIFTLHHANYAEGLYPDGTPGLPYEYCDLYDTMGAYLNPRFNSFHLQSIGWLDPSQVVAVTAPDQTIRLYHNPVNAPGTVQAIVLDSGPTNRQMWIEFHSYESDDWPAGVLLRVPSNLQSPTPTFLWGIYAKSLVLAPLLLKGESVRYCLGDQTITVVDIDPKGQYADVQIHKPQPAPVATILTNMFQSSVRVGDEFNIPIQIPTNYADLERIEVYLNGVLYCQSKSSTFALPWTPAEAGTNTFTVRVVTAHNGCTANTFGITSFASRAHWDITNDLSVSVPLGSRLDFFNGRWLLRGYTTNLWSYDLQHWIPLNTPSPAYGTRIEPTLDGFACTYQTHCYTSRDLVTWLELPFSNSPPSYLGYYTNQFWCLGLVQDGDNFVVYGQRKICSASGSLIRTEPTSMMRTATGWLEKAVTNVTKMIYFARFDDPLGVVELNSTPMLLRSKDLLPLPGSTSELRVGRATYFRGTDNNLYSSPNLGNTWINHGRVDYYGVSNGQLATYTTLDKFVRFGPELGETLPISDLGVNIVFTNVQAIAITNDTVIILQKGKTSFYRPATSSQLAFWQQKMGILDLQADDDGDGQSNLQEYVQGTDPKRKDVVHPQAYRRPDTITWKFPLSRRAGNVRVIFQLSTDLQSWTDYHEVNGMDFDAEGVTVPISLPVQFPQAFLRMRIQP